MDEERHYWAWAASSALHGTMLALILLGFASAPKFDDNPETIPVETVSLNELNQIMNGEKDARPTPPSKPEPEAMQPPKPPEPPPDLRPAEEPQAAAPPPQPPPKPPPPKQATPSPPRSVENAPQPPERPKEPKPEPPKPPKPDMIAKAIEREATEPKPKPERVYDPKAIAKLIGEPKPRTAASESSADSNAAPRGLPRHNAPRMSMSLASALDAWLTDSYLGCWTPPPVMPDGDVYVAEIKVVFNPDGSLSARPVLLNPPADPAWRAHAESAMRAVRKCDPLHVPPQYLPYFEEWKVETIHFDPRETQN